MMLEVLIAILPYVVSVVSVLGVVYTAHQAHNTELTAAYFNKMTAAYEQLWSCLTQFVYTPDPDTRNALAAAVYAAVLYSSEIPAKSIQLVYDKVLDYNRKQIDMKELDRWTGIVLEALHDEVLNFHSRDR